MSHEAHTCGQDVAAYALGALTPDEAQRMRHHLTSCAVCLEELVAFGEVVDELALSPERVVVPRALRRRVLRAVAAEPRLDPAARRSRRRGRITFTMPRLGPVFAGSLALVVAAIVVGGLALGSAGTHRSRTVSAEVTGRGAATLHISAGHGELVLRRFPSAPRGKIYEVWLKRKTGRLQPTTALFGVNGSGDGVTDVPGSLRGVTKVLVTPEPAPGGSRAPTHAPVISVSL